MDQGNLVYSSTATATLSALFPPLNRDVQSVCRDCSMRLGNERWDARKKTLTVSINIHVSRISLTINTVLSPL